MTTRSRSSDVDSCADVSLLTLTCAGRDGDWDEMLSGLKTLLETGSTLYPPG